MKKNVIGGLLQEFARGARRLDDFIGLFREDAEHPQLLDQLKQLGFYSDCLGVGLLKRAWVLRKNTSPAAEQALEPTAHLVESAAAQ